jgi:hypothetical protein
MRTIPIEEKVAEQLLYLGRVKASQELLTISHIELAK